MLSFRVGFLKNADGVASNAGTQQYTVSHPFLTVEYPKEMGIKTRQALPSIKPKVKSRQKKTKKRYETTPKIGGMSGEPPLGSNRQPPRI